MSEAFKDGGPAYPLKSPTGFDEKGMSLRDHFAGLALAALIGKEDKDYQNRGPKAVPILAAFAWEYADAMLRARATGKDGNHE